MSHSRYGIFGGTFDPIHNGHLELADIANRHLNLDKLFFVPNNIPPHRGTPLLSAEHRLAMVEAALMGHQRYLVDDREVLRNGRSYMADTLESFRHELLGDTSPVSLLLGLDSFLTLLEWREPKRIAELAHLVVVARQGEYGQAVELKTRQILDTLYGPGKALQYHPEYLSIKPAGEVLFIEEAPLKVSATELRHKLAENQSVMGLVPDAVEAYIKTHRLYSD